MITLLCAASCSKTVPDNGQQAGIDWYVMTVDPLVDNAAVNGSKTTGQSTKASLINSNDGLQEQGFALSVYDGSIIRQEKKAMTYVNGAWTHAGDAWKWPVKTVYTFVAWSPALLAETVAAESDVSTGNFDFTYTGITTQTDILIGYYKGIGNPDGISCKAPVTFSHPLASVQFKVGTMTGITSINSISVSGVLSEGECKADMTTNPATFLWTGITGDAASLAQTNLTVAPSTGTMIGAPFLVLPQTLSESNLTVTLNVTPISGSSKNITFPVDSGELAPGKTTVYSVSYDGITVGFTASIDPWAPGTDGNVVVDK